MITVSNIKQVLTLINFTTTDNEIYTKRFDNVDCDLKVDFKNKKLIYPTDKGFEVNDGTTSNFEHPENFVVFECVNRLFEKGYRPEHIELEPRWSLGHGGKSGKADICVKNKDDSPYLCIIECKTPGPEYNKEKQNMKADGGQLFSYWQQSKATKWLILYTSDYDETNQTIEHIAETVNCSDDANFIELAKDDKSLKLYRDATTVETLVEVWKETYEQKFLGDIIFDEETVAYDIGILPLKKKRLVDFSRDDKIVNQFEEILRHNNVSDKENAFNRLIALFIAKLYDEKTKSNENEVDFQYKAGTDTYQTMQDRLQYLHHKGMQDFMKEDVFYVSNDYVKTVIKNSIGENREKLEAELNDTITKLKFYTNNDFAFKDVHNKALFYQNGKILVEMVELFQKYRIIDSNELQLLGDMFEQLLNKGFKQNEGQFFTPIPITSFIWKSLPLENIVEDEEKHEVHYPKVIDYACGAGHFLTEGFREINNTIKKLDLPEIKNWESNCIYGIEKDYRLARVSKISMFMHGADNGNIVFGDGLDNHDKDGVVIQNGQFDILVANPPYSVKAFAEHLDLKQNKLKLQEYISKTGNEIETLFVERIAQLLKPKGIAAVILPSSILTNSSTSYIKAREEILKNFSIHSIVQFSSKTFGATGTNTVVLFMQKNNEPPVKSEVVFDNVTAVFSGESLNIENDKELLENYCKQIEISSDKYAAFIQDTKQNTLYTKYQKHKYFGSYVKSFESSTEYKTVQKQDERLKIKDKTEHYENRTKAFYDFVLSVEKEKFYYFALVYRQNVLVVTAPGEDKEQEKFLGYTWSNRKGDEGIKIKSTDAQKSCGLLYNVDDEENSIARYVKDSFLDIYRNGAETTETEISKYLSVNALKDMIDFSRTEFDKAIKPNIQNRERKIESKYTLVKLGDVCDIKIGGTPSRNNDDYFHGENLWVSISEMNGQVINDTKEKITDAGVRDSNVKLIPKGTTLLSFKLSIGKTAIAGKDLYTNEAIAALIPLSSEKVQNKYLFQYFNGNVLDSSTIGNKAFGKSLNSSYLKTEMKIPLPPIDVQKSIIAECEKVDTEYQKAQHSIEKLKHQISDVMENVHNSNFDIVELSKVITGTEYGTSKKSEQKGLVPVIRMGNIQDGHIDMSDLVYSNDKSDIEKFALKKYDVLFNRTNSPVHVGKVGIYLFDKPAIFAGYLIRINYKADIINPVYLCNILNSQKIREYGFSVMSNSINQSNISASELVKYKIPLPPLAEQEKIVSQITKLESKISEAKRIMAACPKKKQNILDKWLK